MKKRWQVVGLSLGIIGLLLLGIWGATQLDQQSHPAPKTVRVNRSAAKIKPKVVKKEVKKVTVKPKPVVVPATGPLTAEQALAAIDQLINDHHIMGTLLLTVNGPAGVKIKTYGYANVDQQIRNTATQAYPLASLQKAVTGSIVQTLINRGKLSMNTPLSKYYPQIPFANQITVRELLNHRSGIRMAEALPKSILPTETAQINYTLARLQSTGNHTYHYTNANFTLLAGIIRQASGHSYMQMLESVIIRPLGLKHTYAYNDLPANAVNPLAYQLSNGASQGTVLSKPLQSAELGCGSLYMSVGDYYKFMESLQSGALVGQAGLAELTSNFAIQYSAGVYYQPGGHIRVGGNDNAFHTYYMGSRDGKIALVLFENQGVFFSDNQVAYAIQQILMRTQEL